MAQPGNSKIRHFMNNAPFWQKYPALVIFCCLFGLISKALIYRFRNGGWNMDWALKFEESLFFGILFGLYAAWPRKSAGQNEQGEQQRS